MGNFYNVSYRSPRSGSGFQDTTGKYGGGKPPGGTVLALSSGRPKKKGFTFSPELEAKLKEARKARLAAAIAKWKYRRYLQWMNWDRKTRLLFKLIEYTYDQIEIAAPGKQAKTFADVEFPPGAVLCKSIQCGGEHQADCDFQWGYFVSGSLGCGTFRFGGYTPEPGAGDGPAATVGSPTETSWQLWGRRPTAGNMTNYGKYTGIAVYNGPAAGLPDWMKNLDEFGRIDLPSTTPIPVYSPAPMPYVLPELLPINNPAPKPAKIPFRVLPYVPNSPWPDGRLGLEPSLGDDPLEFVPGFVGTIPSIGYDPDTRPDLISGSDLYHPGITDPGAGPSVETDGDNVGYGPPHVNAPPPKGTKEGKKGLSGVTKGLHDFADLLGSMLGEAADYVDAVYNGMSKGCKGANTPQKKLACIYNHPERLDIDKVIMNLIGNEIEDRVLGFIGRLNRDASKKVFPYAGRGLQTGGASGRYAPPTITGS